VGLCVERCVEMVVAVLAILSRRVALMCLTLSIMSTLSYTYRYSGAYPLTQSWLVEKLPSQAQVICLDNGVFASQSQDPPGSRSDSENLACNLHLWLNRQAERVLIQHQGLCNVSTSQTPELTARESYPAI